MSTSPFVGARFRAFDANGDPLSGGKLYSYAAGTSTPLSTYTTRAGDVANANPVVLDANGEADVWLQENVEYKFVLENSSSVVQWTVDNFPSSGDGSSTSTNSSIDPGGRLTLTNGTPVTTGDVTGATTIYYAPYKSDQVPLYDGTNWAQYSIGSGLSQATTDNTKSPAAVANNSNYDLFVWNDSGTIRLSRGPAWTSDTARGTGVSTTELEQINGRYVNKNSIANGPAATCGLYVGTVRSDGSAQVNDSVALRMVWNNYSRVRRPMRALETNVSWPYGTASWREANNSSSNNVAFVVGLDESAVEARVSGSSYTASGSIAVSNGIGLDSTTSPNAACARNNAYAQSGLSVALVAFLSCFPGIGYHYLAWLEYGGANAVFEGASGAYKNGLVAEILA